MDINLELITGLSIYYQGIEIRQVPLAEILQMGMDQYHLRLLPFLLSLEDFTLPAPGTGRGGEPGPPEQETPPAMADSAPAAQEPALALSLFDIFTMEQNLPALLDSLSLFCGEQEFAFDTASGRLQIGDGFLDRHNFAGFAEIILRTNAKEKTKTEKPPAFKNDRQRDIWEKIQAGRRRKAQRQRVELYDLINVCQFGGPYYIPMQEILSWSLWRISNCYQSILGGSAYRDNFQIYCVTGEKEIIENKHWTDLIKIH